MRYVSFSFDDSREDTYTNALRILNKYGMKATINVTTDFVLNPNRYVFRSAGNRAMTVAQLRECQCSGVELACHGSKHLNTTEDILQSISELNAMGIKTDKIGFASPSSELTIDNRNDHGIWNLVENGTLAYVRSGIQIKREGIICAGFSILDSVFHSRYLFQHLNKKCTFRGNNNLFLPSIAVYEYTTVEQILNFLHKMKDGEKAIFMFHSILPAGDGRYGADKFFWDAGKFETLVATISKYTNFTVLTTKEMLKEA